MNRLLWHSNAPWSSTGYGVQTALFTPQLAKQYELAISAFYGLEGNRLDFNGVTVLPGYGQTYGDRQILGHAKQHLGEKGGLVATLMDVFVLDADLWKTLNLACWVPVDHQPAPPAVRQFFKETGAVPIAMSRFGQRMLAEFDPLYCPHGVDTQAYKPVPRAEARRRAGIPQEAFVVGMVAANKGNPSRKCFSEAFQAFRALRNTHDDALLYLHTELSTEAGVRLPMLLADLNLGNEAVFATDQHRYLYNPLPPAAMATCYSAFDVLLSPSAGEGFGVPILEAAACGVPSVVSDFSAMPEVAPTGASWLVEGQRTWTWQHSWQVTPNVEDILDGLQQAYARPRAQVEAHARAAREHALQYDVDRVFKEHLLPSLQAAEERLGLREREEVAA